MTRGSESDRFWDFEHPPRCGPPDPFAKPWMSVPPLHQRRDRIGGVAVTCMNASDRGSLFTSGALRALMPEAWRVPR